MPVHRNLISNSVLVQETVELLQASGGRALATDIADEILRISNLDASLALQLIEDLIRDDARLTVGSDLMIELCSENADLRKLAQAEFVVVDVETTGAKAPPGRMTEIGAYRISGNQIVDEFETLVNPECEIPPFIVGLTGITNDMVQSAPVFAAVVGAWLDFAGDAVLVAHNAAFDVRFINHEVARVFPGCRMANVDLCTVKLARHLLPDLENHRLHTVAQHFAVSIRNRHRAAGDALATAEVFLRLLELLDASGVASVADAKRLRRPNVRTESKGRLVSPTSV